MPLPVLEQYLDVAYDPTQNQYTVWVVQYGQITSSIAVKSSSTISVIAKRLGCPVYTDHLGLALVLAEQGITVIRHRFGV
jgi:hypothetical protein